MTQTAQLDRIEWPVWRIAIITASGAFLSSIDASVVAVGLDTIGADLHTDLAQVQWVSSVYLIGVAVAMPLSGWLGGRLGAGRLWIQMMAAFTVLSVLCALAPTVETLIAARAAQGFAGGMLIPAGQTLIGQAVGSNRLGRVMGTLGVVVGLGGAAGPTLGGFVLDNLSWPWLFWINLPIGVLAVVLGHRYVPRGATVPVTRFDWRGFALVGAGLPLVIYGLTAWGEGTSLTTAVAGTLVLGFAAILAFGAHSLRRTDPLLDLRLFTDRVYAAAVLSVFLLGAAMFGGIIIQPLYFQILLDKSAGATGVFLLWYGLGTSFIMLVAGRLADRHGGGIVAVAGTALMVATTIPFAFLGSSPSEALVLALLFARGAGTGLAMMPAMTAAYAAIESSRLSQATAQVNITMRVGGALGGALFTVALAASLSSGALSAFHQTFWYLTGTSVAAVAAAVWLWSASFHARQSLIEGAS